MPLCVAADYSKEFWPGTEVEKEANLQVCALEVTVSLPERALVQLERRLDFDDELSIDDHIQSLKPEFFTLVHHSNAEFARDMMPSRQEFALERENI